MIVIYKILNIILFPLYLLLLLARLLRGKENMLSIRHRLGIGLPLRPSGKLIWMHAASVGESMVAITLVEALNKKHSDLNFLITTGTLSSAKILSKWLPSNATHQFLPLDILFIVKNFLEHYRPSLGIFIESEFWPCLISEAAKNFDLLLVNARLSDRSYRRWKRRKALFQQITGHFKKIAVQSKKDLEKYKHLGVNNAVNLGNLKFANKELEVNGLELKKLQKIFGDKKVFVASSTHSEDEEVALKIIKDFKHENIDYYPMIILRHPERMSELAKECKKLGLKYSVRSKGQAPSLSDDLYIVDSFGELGLFYSLAHMSFVGGSFKRGGHNLAEPAYFDNIIVLGPDMSNFQNIADEMIEKEAALQISDAAELEEKIKFFFASKNQKMGKKLSENAKKYVSDRKETINLYLNEIERFLP